MLSGTWKLRKGKKWVLKKDSGKRAISHLRYQRKVIISSQLQLHQQQTPARDSPWSLLTAVIETVQNFELNTLLRPLPAPVQTGLSQAENGWCRSVKSHIYEEPGQTCTVSSKFCPQLTKNKRSKPAEMNSVLNFSLICFFLQSFTMTS